MLHEIKLRDRMLKFKYKFTCIFVVSTFSMSLKHARRQLLGMDGIYQNVIFDVLRVQLNWQSKNITT